MKPSRVRQELLQVGCAVDGTGMHCAPACVLIEQGVVLAVGSPQQIGEVPDAVVRQLSEWVVMPPFANAHAHLDLSMLTGLAVVAREHGFSVWLDRVRTGRPSSEQGLRDAVLRGIELSRIGGVGWIGDIAGRRSMASFEALADSPMHGVSYIEVFGLCGDLQREAVAFVQSLRPRSRNGVQLGISPHAPYTAGALTYQAALQLPMPFSTHLSESAEELECMLHGRGPMFDFALSLGVVPEQIQVVGRHPVPWFLEQASAWRAHHVARAISLAHVNEIETNMFESLAASGMVVAHCPRSNAFFGRPGVRGEGHRWREMLAAGVRVALATDGMPSLDREDRITPLDDARLIWKRGGAQASQLLAMISLHGLAAMALATQQGVLRVGASHGLIGFEVADCARGFAAVLDSDAAPLWLLQTSKPKIA